MAHADQYYRCHFPLVTGEGQSDAHNNVRLMALQTRGRRTSFFPKNKGTQGAHPRDKGKKAFLVNVSLA